VHHQRAEQLTGFVLAASAARCPWYAVSPITAGILTLIPELALSLVTTDQSSLFIALKAATAADLHPNTIRNRLDRRDSVADS